MIFVDNFNPSAISPFQTFQTQWYHGTLDRQEATKILHNYAKSMKENQKSNKSLQNDSNNSNSDEIDDVSTYFFFQSDFDN